MAFARAGADVVVHYRSSRAEAEKTAKDIVALGRKAWLVQGALDSEEDAARVFADSLAASGGLDVLVNNASVFPADTLHAFSAAQAMSILNTNTFAPLALMRTFAAQDSDGCIINLLDTTIREYDRAHFSYHLSKRLLHTLTRACALEFAPRVRVNGVAPGAVMPPEGQPESYLAARGEETPLQAYGHEGHIAEAVLFLARSTFVTGQIIHVDGGRHLMGCVYD